ncbi:MAG: hypothetical protein QM723_23325 [Myxococcaceae bacterium]
MLDALLAGRIDEFQAKRTELLARGRLDREVVDRLERAVSADPSLFEVDAKGFASLSDGDRTFAAGKFEVLSIAELRKRARPSGRPRLFALLGADPSTDIGALQSTAAPDSLFQVASQFNCLEAPDAMLVPVFRYFRDPTQGPRASISAFAGTLLRHYRCPFTQTEQKQINLLADALPVAVGRVESGYLMTQHIADLTEAANALERNFDRICVGVHEGLEVCFGHQWDGEVLTTSRIAQVFTSTLALGYSEGSYDAHAAMKICRQLLRAAYLGTLLGAASLGKRTVVLTLIGGGVFQNSHRLILEAIEWALEQVPHSMDVVINCREIDHEVRPALLAATQARGGRCFEIQNGQVL